MALSDTQIKYINFLKERPVEFGRMLGFTKLTELHNGWIQKFIFNNNLDECLQAHRGSYKTTCGSIGIAIHMILLPRDRLIFMRKTENDVKEIISQIAKILKDPHTKYFVMKIWNVPDFSLVTETATSLTTSLVVDNSGIAQLNGYGLGSSLTGKHADFIWDDDICNLTDRVSGAEREFTKTVYQELQNVKNRGGKILSTGTPWHRDDVFTLMPEPEKYDCYSTGLMTEEEIEYCKAHMEPSLFAANYELTHIKLGDAIFTERPVEAAGDKLFGGFSHVDSAYGGDDFTAMSIMSRDDATGKYYLFGKLWQKPVQEVLPQIAELHNSFQCRLLYTEDNGDKGFVAQKLNEMRIPTQTYHEKQNKAIKISTCLRAIWPEVVIVEGTDPEYISQVLDFTVDGKGHDDAPDSAACLARVWQEIKPEVGYKSLFLL